MKRILLSALCIIVLSTTHAQLRYTFSTQTGQTYTPLTTGATNLTANIKWDDNVFAAPIGFTFGLNGRAINDAFISTDGITTIGQLTNDTLTGIVPTDADIYDRGNASTGTARLSPIRYATTGTAPSRIFKLEFFNAGFADDDNDTDSTNFQVWMYEGTNVLELHYGPSRVTAANFGDYFNVSSGPVVGFASDIILSGAMDGTLYNLQGATTAPTIDSIVLPAASTTALTGYPASGTVYRFTPVTGGTSSISEALAAARALILYPSVATESIAVIWSGKAGEAYEIISANGQRVAAGALQVGSQTILVGHLSVGTYMLRIRSGTHQFTKR